MLTIFLRRRCSRGCSRLANTRVGSSGAKSSNKKRIKVSPSCLLCPGLYYYYYYYYFSRASFPRASIEKTLKNVFDKKKNRILFHFHACSLLISISFHLVSTLLLRCSLRILSRSVRNIFIDIFYFWILLSSSSSSSSFVSSSSSSSSSFLSCFFSLPDL